MRELEIVAHYRATFRDPIAALRWARARGLRSFAHGVALCLFEAESRG